MNILAIDTAGRSASAALLRDDAVLYETVCNCGLTHSETLMPMIDAALKTGGVRPDQLDLYAVTAGPGSFTGLRIGLAAVKGMALAAGTPCAGVSTLEALAWCHTGSGTVIAALDARRGQVYWAAFDLKTHARPPTPPHRPPRPPPLPKAAKNPFFMLATAPHCATIGMSRRCPARRRCVSAVRRARGWPAGLCTWPGRASPLPR